jgi:PST family polysaccharide transporter
MGVVDRLLGSETTEHKLLGNIFWLFSLQGLNYLIPLAVLPFLVRVLGIERYGLLAFAQSLAQYFVIFTDYGFNLSATKQIARARLDRERVSSLFWCVIILKLALMFVSAIVLAILLVAVPRFHSEISLYAVAFMAVIGTVLFPTWLFQGMEQMKYISVVSGSAKLLSAVALFIFVRDSSDYVLALAILSGGMLFSGVIGLVVAITKFGIIVRMPTKAEIADTLRDGWHLFVSTAATTFYTNSNVFLVGMFAGNVQAGYFSAAEKIVRGMQGLLGPITQAIYPHVNSLAGSSRELALAFLRKSFIWIGVFSFIPSFLLFLFAQPVSRLILGSTAVDVTVTFRWMAMLPFVIAISNVLGIQTMIPFGFERQLSRIYLFAGLGSLVLSISLIRHYGALGAAISVLTVELVIVFCMWESLRTRGVNVLRAAAIRAPSAG